MMSGNDGIYRRTVLDNGVRVVTEKMPHVRSLAIGIWLNTGSRDEPDELSGISHFLEHMNFKGTPRRSAAAIARQIEGRGGHLNAFTSKEVTCYHARVIDQQLLRAVDILSDIIQHSLYDPNELDRERTIIFEEVKNLEDTPDEWVFEHFINQIYPGHPMGRSILGRRETLKAIDRSKLIDYRDKRYTGSRVVVAASGNLEHNRLVRMIERRFRDHSSPELSRDPPAETDPGRHQQDVHTNTQQAHICWGCRSFTYNDPRKYPLLILHTLLGGGMSSRLFQRIRERHGLAYSVYTFLETYFDTGLFGIYAGCEPQKAKKVLSLISSEVSRLSRQLVSTRELQRTKDQLKGNLLLGLESPANRMHRLAKMEIYTSKWLSLDEVIARIDAVSTEDVRNVARDQFDRKAIFTTILWPN